jgi:hypothetical protein
MPSFDEQPSAEATFGRRRGPIVDPKLIARPLGHLLHFGLRIGASVTGGARRSPKEESSQQ